MTISQSQPLTIQKTSFLTIEEFWEWLHLVEEIADHPLDAIEITEDTRDMIVREWQSLRGYSWTDVRVGCSSKYPTGLTINRKNRRPVDVYIP